MRNLLAVIGLLVTAVSVKAQSDKNAVSVLDRFSSKALGSAALFMKFDLVTVDLKDNSRDTLSGSILLSKDKYILDLGNNIIWSNGETSWSYLAAEKEVTVNRIDRKDNSFQNKPSEVFSMYKKGYKNRMVEERTDSYIIDLYPEDLNNELQRVRLRIGKSSLNLISAEYRRKDGVSATLVMKEYDTARKPDPDGYVFKPEKYKGVEIIDMR